jgi:hypothetical protein
MRILLQQIESGLYMKTGGGWTKTPDEALCFDSAEVARSYGDFGDVPDTFVVLLPDASAEAHHEFEHNIVELSDMTAQADERLRTSRQASSRF